MRSQQPFMGPGTAFAGYEIDSTIGRGGMGVVYLARDVRLDRRVALKLLAPEYTANENFRARFLRESRLAAAVDHPHIIPIYEAGDADGQLFIAMRYVPGADLRTELDERGRLDVAEALPLLQQIADALDAAHAAGLVHRDVKPGNVLLAEAMRHGRRHAYLTDFGLTRRSSSISGLTTTGHFLGTLDYVAPEQIRGDPVDGRADVYSFACVAYTVLTGRPPFDAEDDVALMWAHLSRVPPRASAVRPELAAGLDDALAAGLAKSREDRPDTCGALVARMEGRASSPAESGASSPSPRPDQQSPSAAPPERDQPPPEVSDPVIPRPVPPSEVSIPPDLLPQPGEGMADGVPRRPRTASRWSIAGAAVAAIAVAVVAGILLLPLGGNSTTDVAVDGLPYTLEVPEEWAVDTFDAGDSSVTVMSPADVTGLFTNDPGGLQEAADAVATDAGAVVGLAIYHRPRLDETSPVAQLSTAEALLPGRDVDLRPGDRVQVGDLEATAMAGTIGLAGDAALQVRVLALDSVPHQLLVFFAPPSVFAERTETFDRVADSLESIG